MPDYDNYENVEDEPIIYPRFRFPKFTMYVPADGRICLTIRTDDESELEALTRKWDEWMSGFFGGERYEVNGKSNGKEHQGNGDKGKARYYVGDTCPECSNKLVKRQGRNGAFGGCNNYPECRFTFKL